VGAEDAPEDSATLDRRWTKGGHIASGNEWNVGPQIQATSKSSVTRRKEEVSEAAVLVESRCVIAGIDEK